MASPAVLVEAAVMPMATGPLSLSGVKEVLTRVERAAPLSRGPAAPAEALENV
jgi:hypothetical protein